MGVRIAAEAYGFSVGSSLSLVVQLDGKFLVFCQFCHSRCIVLDALKQIPSVHILLPFRIALIFQPLIELHQIFHILTVVGNECHQR